jgi:Peptidyl-tRNA hydrolase PTH2
MPHGVQLAQLTHAAGESVVGRELPPDTHAVVLAAAGEDELLAISAALAQAGVEHVTIREPDPPYLGAATALGIPPQERAPLRRLLRHLKRAGGDP